MLASGQKLARELKRVRRKAGLSQAEAARRAGVSAAWLCQVERGARKPSQRLAAALEPVYGVGASVGGRKLTLNVEIDGPQHDAERDTHREDDVGLPVLRYRAETVNAPGFINRLFTDLKRAVELHSAGGTG